MFIILMFIILMFMMFYIFMCMMFHHIYVCDVLPILFNHVGASDTSVRFVRTKAYAVNFYNLSILTDARSQK